MTIAISRWQTVLDVSLLGLARLLLYGEAMSQATLSDLRVAHVDDDGAVTLELPGGALFELRVSRELVGYYRRLLDGNLEESGTVAGPLGALSA